MKRIRIAPGKFVTISTAMADKAARVFATPLTPEQVRAFKSPEPTRVSGPMLGSTKPLVLSKPVMRIKGSGAAVEVVHRAAVTVAKSQGKSAVKSAASATVSPRKVTMAGVLRRKTG